MIIVLLAFVVALLFGFGIGLAYCDLRQMRREGRWVQDRSVCINGRWFVLCDLNIVGMMPSEPRA